MADDDPARRAGAGSAPEILISAGDPSGAIHAARLAVALAKRAGARLFGLGTPLMREAGVELVADASSIAVVGLSEALSLLPRAWWLLRRLEREAARRRPRLAILVDFPDFNLQLARRLHLQGHRIIYFISPQVWAWRSGRIGAIRKYVERMLVIFPFEEQFYRTAGVPAEFVGHPLADAPLAAVPRDEFCRRHGLDPGRQILALLPGSRPKEVAHNLPPMLAACARIAAESPPGPQAVLAAAPALGVGYMESLRRGLPAAAGGVRPKVVEHATYDALAAADCAIVASGTATVESALLGAPLVVVYRVSRASALVLKRLIHTPFYSMVNLLLDRPAVPELVQQDFTPEPVAREVRRLLESADERTRMKRDLAEVRRRLASPSPSGAIARAAEIIAGLL